MQKQLLSLIKKKLKELSVSQLATRLGYRSPNTIRTWLNNKRIPTTAVSRLKHHFRKEIK